jgi:hypothetical protein
MASAAQCLRKSLKVRRGERRGILIQLHTFGGKIGASEGIRTLDTHVGNVMLYQAELRSLPLKRFQNKRNQPDCKRTFKGMQSPKPC